MIVAVVDSELEGFLTEGLELVDLVGVLVSVDHAQSFSLELVAIDRYELQAEALRMIDADKYADKINELEAFRQEAFQFAVDNGYDHPDYTDWVYSGVNTNKQGAVSATAATAGDNE